MNYLTRGGRFFLFRVGCYDVNGRVGGCNMDETEHIIQIIHPPTVLLQIDSIISAYAHFPYFSVAIFFHKNEKKNLSIINIRLNTWYQKPYTHNPHISLISIDKRFVYNVAVVCGMRLV